MGNVNVKIREQRFFNNGDLLLPSIKDSSGKLLKEGIEEWLNQSYDLTPSTHREKGETWTGYTAGELNSALRDKMVCVSGIHGETYVDFGAILTKGKKGFDFSLFDEEYNIVRLRNSFVGNPGRYNGNVHLEKLNKNVLKADNSVYSKRDWKKKITDLGGVLGQNIEYDKKQYTVAGEIQFGNWALAGHDLLRLLNSAIAGEIDYYVYITATGGLQKSLSKGITNYTRVVELFSDNKQLIKTPIWVIGIDVDE